MLNKQPTLKAPAATFTGDAWHDVIAKGEAPSRTRVNVVRFAPGAALPPLAAVAGLVPILAEMIRYATIRRQQQSSLPRDRRKRQVHAHPVAEAR